MNIQTLLDDLCKLTQQYEQQQNTIDELRGQIRSMEQDEANKKWYKEQVGIISDCATVAAKTKANELDRYAIPAMQAILSGRIDFATTMEVAAKAYAQAEEMIAERNKRTQ